MHAANSDVACDQAKIELRNEPLGYGTTTGNAKKYEIGARMPVRQEGRRKGGDPTTWARAAIEADIKSACPC